MISQQSAIESAQWLVDKARKVKEDADRNGGDPEANRAYDTALGMLYRAAATSKRHRGVS